MRTLADRLARGEDSAFTELYDACADRLHGFAAARLGSREAASDIVQAVFMRAVRSRRRFRKVESPVAYLFQIARNEVARAVAKRQRRREQPLDDARSISSHIAAANDDDAEAVAAALGRLDARDRELVELKLYAGLTFREIAAATRQPPGTVATRYRRCLESLRGWLEKQYR
ncbi:MAG: RNA polymerase sigma factor [Pirellulales bacterium]|nr:RNA polymerase sigma factor [Pirellulales bacterium]